MPLYLIERQFAERLEVTPEGIAGIEAINAEAGVEWLHSFLSADQTKTYCLYQASDPEAIRRAAEAAGIPADKIVEVSQFGPTG
ncbi:nickel-binding protein [Sphingomicrobium aestuariivivum]|uniref:nickel-binding protein n=1 Tax=Sphingomicrobium aestuariivivum TaxID=1582356 RepID=UPI001FD635AA|nr:nickel-binding protein [Sphingomicrobium aestuariivivum]MCJ8191896.1 DUF4242 domain-containing protein [Sphingomicrobium aestuariivivum]